MRAFFVQKYEAGIKKKKFMFVFVIDYNDRSCVIPSCKFWERYITQQLCQCDQGSQYDIPPNTCASVPTEFQPQADYGNQSLLNFHHSRIM